MKITQIHRVRLIAYTDTQRVLIAYIHTKSKINFLPDNIAGKDGDDADGVILVEVVDDVEVFDVECGLLSSLPLSRLEERIP